MIVYCYSIPQVLALRSLHVEPHQAFPSFLVDDNLFVFASDTNEDFTHSSLLTMAQHCVWRCSSDVS